MLRIDSGENKKIKRLISLKQKKVRLKENLFLIEGIKSVDEAVSLDADIDMILVSEQFAEKNKEYCIGLQNGNYPVYITSNNNFSKCSSLKTPQGILASLKYHKIYLSDILKKSGPLVVLDGINDPGNLGTIIRTADAFSFEGVLLLPDCADVHNTKTVQASMGSILRTACIEITLSDLDELIKEGYFMFGMDVSGNEIEDISFADRKTAVIIGSESHGISSEVQKKCSTILKINMPGKAESLNAAVAAGIAMNKISEKITVE